MRLFLLGFLGAVLVAFLFLLPRLEQDETIGPASGNTAFPAPEMLNHVEAAPCKIQGPETSHVHSESSPRSLPSADRARILKWLNAFHERTEEPKRRKFLDRIRRLSEANERVIPFLIECFEKKGLTSWNAFRALEVIGPAAVPALIKALSHPGHWTRRYALLTLQHISPLPVCHFPLIWSLAMDEEETDSVRANAMGVLPGFAEDLPELSGVLSGLKGLAMDGGCEGPVRRAALRALAALSRSPEQREAALDLLVSMVENPGEASSLPETAVSALETMAKDQALLAVILPVLVNAFRSAGNDERLRSDCADSAFRICRKSGADHGFLFALADVLASEQEDEFFRESLAEELCELGPMASPLLPCLLAMLEKRRRFLAQRADAEATDTELDDFSEGFHTHRCDLSEYVARAILHIAPGSPAHRTAVLHLALEHAHGTRDGFIVGQADQEDDDPAMLTYDQVHRILVESLAMPNHCLLALQIVQKTGIYQRDVFQGVQRACEDPRESVRGAAARALCSANLDAMVRDNGSGTDREDISEEEEERLLRETGECIKKTLLNLLHDASPLIREAACDALFAGRYELDGYGDLTSLMERLEELAARDTGRVRAAASAALACLPEEVCKTKDRDLQPLLRSKDPGVRLRAATLLKGLDLLPLLDDPAPSVRRMALRLLEEHEDEFDDRAMTLVAKRLARHAADPCVEVRIGVARTIADFDSKVGLPVLIRMLEDGDQRVRSFAVGSLECLGSSAEAAVPRLIEAYPQAQGELRQDIVRALGEIGSRPAEVIPFLIALLEDRDDEIKSDAAAALAKFGADAETAIPSLLSLLKDKNLSAVRAAAQALEKIGCQPSLVVPALHAALERNQCYGLPQVIGALGSFGPDARCALPRIRSILQRYLSQEYGQYTVGAALYAIARIAPDDEDTLPLLIKHLKRPGRTVPSYVCMGLTFLGARAGPALPHLKAALQENSLAAYDIRISIRAIEKATGRKR
jgi:HEAT repeat protein